MQTVIIVSLLAIVLILLNTAASSVHQAVFADDLAAGKDQAISFSQPQLDRVFYTGLARSGEVDFYQFQGQQGTLLKARILIPKLSGLDTFHPALALFGSGLPTPADSQIYTIPFNLPQGNGLVLSNQDKTNSDKTNSSLYDTYIEPYTQAEYWTGQNIVLQLPATGSYYLAVFDLNNHTGKYALEVGDQDSTGIKETLSFPLTWVQVHLWFNDPLTPAWVISLLVIIAIVLILLFNFKRIFKRSTPAPQAVIPANVETVTADSTATYEPSATTTAESTTSDNLAQIDSSNEITQLDKSLPKDS